MLSCAPISQPFTIEITTDGSGGAYDLGLLVGEASFIVLAPLAELIVEDPVEPDCLHVKMTWVAAEAWYKDQLFSLLPAGENARITAELKDELSAIEGTLSAAEALKSLMVGKKWARSSEENEHTIFDLTVAQNQLQVLKDERARREEPKCLALSNDGDYVGGWNPPVKGKKKKKKKKKKKGWSKKLHLRLQFKISETCGALPDPFTGVDQRPKVVGFEVVSKRDGSETTRALEGGTWKQLPSPSGARGRARIEFNFSGSPLPGHNTSGLRFEATLTGGRTDSTSMITRKEGGVKKPFYVALQREKGLQARPEPDTTIVVFGGSGVGKSTLLNSILGVDKVLPIGYQHWSSGMAGTAGITEINYENSKPPALKFRFEVEMMNYDELREEVKSLLIELTEGSEENEDSEDDDDDDDDDDDEEEEEEAGPAEPLVADLDDGMDVSEAATPALAMKDRQVRLCVLKPSTDPPPHCTPEEKEKWEKQRVMFDALRCRSKPQTQQRERRPNSYPTHH